MSSSYSIMVRPIDHQTAEVLITDASTIFGQRFTPTGYHDGEYEIIAPGGLLILNVNYGWDEPGYPIPYEKFCWKFNMYDARDPERHVTVLNTLRTLYDGLVDSGRYQAMFHPGESDEILASNLPGYETEKNW